jgi:predicted ribosome-associated RNA-binding protein Tma20
MFAEMQLAESKSQVLKVYVHQGVETFLFNGADLMWKGISRLSRQEFKMHELV